MKPGPVIWGRGKGTMMCSFPLSAYSHLFYSMEGGELFSRIQERGDQAFTERGMCM